MTAPDLSADERDLLEWLSKEDYSQYGECHGPALDVLMARGLAQVHGPGEHQNFIASDPAGVKGIMFRAVSLTEAGWMAVKAMRNDTCKTCGGTGWVAVADQQGDKLNSVLLDAGLVDLQVNCPDCAAGRARLQAAREA